MGGYSAPDRPYGPSKGYSGRSKKSGKDTQHLIVHMAQVKDIVDVPKKVEKDTQHLIVHMAQVKDIVDVLTKVEKDTRHLIVHMAQVKDIVDVLTVTTVMERATRKSS